MPDTQISIQSEETAIEFIQEQVAIDFVQEQVAIEFVQETTQINFVSDSIVLNLTGVPGPVGPPGADGADGADGVGVPAGGSAGQVLAKIDGDDFNTEWVDQDGGGGPGGASITDITYADMQTAITDGTLTEGAFYRITDAAGTDLGFVCQAIKTNEITVNGTGGYLNADFQSVGDYSGVEAVTGVVFMTPIGIWRTGFEVITIPYTNLSPDYIEYSTASGPLDDGETYTTDLGGSGTIIHDDGASIVTIIPSGALVAGEIITGDISGNTVTVDTYTHPVFVVGDTITGGNTGATAVIVTDDGASSMTAYMTSAGVAFDGSEVLDNGDGITADMDGAQGTPDIVQGDVVIWNLLHWQLTDATLLSGTDPATNTAAYTQLLKTDTGQGYITQWDVSEFDFANNWLQYRADLLGNLIRYSKGIDDQNFGYGFSIIPFFQWGNENWYGNESNDGAIYQPNSAGFQMAGNILHAGAFVADNVADKPHYFQLNVMFQFSEYRYNNLLATGNYTAYRQNTQQPFAFFNSNSIGNRNEVINNTLFPGASISSVTVGDSSGVNIAIGNNILENGAQLTGITAGANCSISKNKLGSSSVFGGGIVLGDGASIDEMEFAANTGMSDVSLGVGTQMSGYVLFPNANVNTITLGDGTASQNNILENGAQLTGITAGANCSISRNKIGQGATLGDSTTMGDGAEMTDNVIGNSAAIAENIIVSAGILSGNTLGASSSVSRNTFNGESFSFNVLAIDAQVNDNVVSEGYGISYCEIYGTITECVLTGINSKLEGVRILRFQQNSIENVLFGYIDISNIEIQNKTFTADVESKTATIGYSNLEETIDIAGLTTLDCLVENNYVGIFNLTSSNAAEAIDTITNQPTLFPFTIRPSAGLVLTITGTAYSGIAAGQIALKAASYTLDGDKGEYIVLEIDPRGTGCLIEKYVGNGLI